MGTATDWDGRARSPLNRAEAEFLRIAPDRLLLDGPSAALIGAAAPVPLNQVREALLRPMGHAVRDAVWRTIIARAVHDREWMLGAVGLAMPALRAAAHRSCRGLDADARDDVDAAVLAGFIAAVRAADPGWTRLVWRLRCRAQRAGLQARHHQTQEATIPAATAASEAPRAPWGHPDLVLAAAVKQGVISAGEAQLIAESRLEPTTLKQIAADLGVPYLRLHKRRSRAEARLVAAITAGDLPTLLSTSQPDDLG
ncbi:hypothetical protein CLV63_112122 [Murinocardiopsis flavida]|uniref:DNA-directed RNA polymerase specialized sigma24 family protein n=1 Tax=Murinocardiopsis flavida TaxID=645275 RepID=A0A2P8DGA0_9ACTN|nr:hypothetical protein [Murinocardiopsis flavida]PSK96240.1 hypothetical protein CLV63_112122 [Murinocardiopsis flavida]